MEHNQPVVDREEITRKYALIRKMAEDYKPAEGSPTREAASSSICSLEAKEKGIKCKECDDN